MSLQDIRANIDEIDDEISALFRRRLDIMEDVVRAKGEDQKPIFDEQREKEIIQRLQGTENHRYDRYIDALYSEIFSLSRSYQKVLAKENMGIASSTTRKKLSKQKPKMQLLVINGPNINMLGIREPEIYGKKTYADLVEYIHGFCNKNEIGVEVCQSNHEGDIVTKIQSAYNKVDGIIINPAAYTHTSIAILDALKAVAIPAVEVHLSPTFEREVFRKVSYPGMACVKTISGKGFDGYIEAIEYFLS